MLLECGHEHITHPKSSNFTHEESQLFGNGGHPFIPFPPEVAVCDVVAEEFEEPVLGHWQTIQPRESTIAHSTRQLLGKGWHPLMFPWDEEEEEEEEEEEDGAGVFPVCPALPDGHEQTIHPMESIRAHSALQFLGNGVQPFTCDGLAVAPELVNVCGPADWGFFGHEHIGHPMSLRARQFGSQCVGNEGHPLLFPADVDAAAPVCVEFEDVED